MFWGRENFPITLYMSIHSACTSWGWVFDSWQEGRRSIMAQRTSKWKYLVLDFVRYLGLNFIFLLSVFYFLPFYKTKNNEEARNKYFFVHPGEISLQHFPFQLGIGEWPGTFWIPFFFLKRICGQISFLLHKKNGLYPYRDINIFSSFTG